MKKTALVLSVFMLLLCLAGCAHEVVVAEPTTGSADTKAGEVDIGEVYMSISNYFNDKEPREHDKDFIANNYLIEAELIKNSECVTYTMGDYAFSGEIVLVEAVDNNAAKTVFDALDKRLEDIRNQAKSYAEADYNLASEVEVLQRGNCVALFYSDNFAEMAEIFNK